jgi:hypothetical protein
MAEGGDGVFLFSRVARAAGPFDRTRGESSRSMIAA